MADLVAQWTPKLSCLIGTCIVVGVKAYKRSVDSSLYILYSLTMEDFENCHPSLQQENSMPDSTNMNNWFVIFFPSVSSALTK